MSTTTPIDHYTEIDISEIKSIPDDYPKEFVQFCIKHKIKLPKKTTMTGKALLVMLVFRFRYFTREKCNEFVKKFKIPTKDSIQLFNKFAQKGIQTNSGMYINKYFIVYPYRLSSKCNLRKNCKYDGTFESKYQEIEKIKKTIFEDYINVPNDKWHIGHKNPHLDGSLSNLILQPPIQAKYRDHYIFTDSLTKIPVANKLKSMIEKKEIVFSQTQIYEYLRLFISLKS